MENHTQKNMARIEKLKTKKTDQEMSNLSLIGSQINLANRETNNCREYNNNNSKLINRSFSTNTVRRPMSATPTLCTFKNDELRYSKSSMNWTRPQSADNVSYRKNVKDLMYNKLGSSRLLEKLIKEPVMRSWAVTHSKSPTPSNTPTDTSSTQGDIFEMEDLQLLQSATGSTMDLNEEDEGEDTINNSEISFGTKIQNLAQKTSPPSLDLQPGIKHKPPLPTNKRTEEIKQLGSPKKVTSEYFYGQQRKSPTNVSMSKEYQNKYYKNINAEKTESEILTFFHTSDILNERSFESFDDCSNLNDKKPAPQVDTHFSNHDNEIQESIVDISDGHNSHIDELYFQGWQINGDKSSPCSESDTKVKEIKVFEKETDMLLNKLRTHEHAFNEYCETAKKLPVIFETSIKTPSTEHNSSIQPDDIGFGDMQASNHLKIIEDAFSPKLNDTSEGLVVRKSAIQNNGDSVPSSIEVKRNNDQNQKAEAQFSLDDYDKRLTKDKEFLGESFETHHSNGETNESNSTIPEENPIEKNNESSKAQFQTPQHYNFKQENEIHIDDLMSNNNLWSMANFTKTPLEDIPEKPERDTNKKKVEIVKNVLSTLPSTFEDISGILNFLEGNKPVEKSKKEEKPNIDINKWIMENSEKTPDINVERLQIRDDKSVDFKMSSSKNYAEILSFLDEVDQSCSVILNAAKIRAYGVKQTTEKVIAGSLPSIESLLQKNHVDLAHELIGLSLELEEKASSINLLQAMLKDQREIAQKMVKDREIENKKKVKSQKEEYESIIKRHQKFIDQLINEKKSLTGQCETLIKQLKQQEERHISVMKAAEHRFNVELQRMKERQIAGEKMRREKWIVGKTEKIKEMTVKGLEPELNNMQLRHQQEISDLRTMHKQEIEELEMRAARRTHQQLEALREQLNLERDQIIGKEREAMNQRIQQTIENEERNYQEQRRRLISEQERYKQRLDEEYSAKLAECEVRIETIIKEKERSLQMLKSEFDDAISTLIRKHKNELKTTKETIEMEQEAWQNNLKKEQTTWQNNKEAEIRAQCKRERDREIELVIERLENESIELKSQIELATENRIKRLVEKYSNEIKYLEESEQQAQKRYLDVKNQLITNENDMIYLRGVIKNLETKLEETEQTSKQLLNERENIRERIQQEFIDKIKSLENQLITLQTERENELQEVYARVKAAIARKDATAVKMKEEQILLEQKCSRLEQLLENQRRTYLLENK